MRFAHRAAARADRSSGDRATPPYGFAGHGVDPPGPHHKRIWYVADGLYSMLGDFADFEALKQLLDAHAKLRLYIDDAHGTS